MLSTIIILVVVGFFAGFLSGAVGFGGSMIMIPLITFFYGVDVAVPVSTVAQLISNLSKAGFGFKDIDWRKTFLFLVFALPLTALGSIGFASVDKKLMTCLLSVFLIVFAVMKLRGKMHLPHSKWTVLIGGGITGVINGLLGISGPLSSAVFLTFNLSPVSYIASESAAAAAMHAVKAVMYGKFDLMSGTILLEGLYIGIAMMTGNYFAIKRIRNVNKKAYQRLVAAVMIIASLGLIVTSIL
jgi:uncharacterized membrane protein YfcA